ncbi:MAG: hypothetical protein ACI88H_000136 [Cocleimonas sp.]|jgi:hypothetical protein
MKDNYLLLVKEQAIAGVAETLTGADVIETTDGVQVGEYEGEFITRKVDGVIATAGEEINKAPHQTVTTKVDMAGCGSATNAAVIGKLLQACGFTRTADDTLGAEQEIFTLDNNNVSKLLTLGRYVGDKKFNSIPDVRGNVDFAFDSFISMALNFIGSYVRPVEAPFPGSIVYSNYAEPLPVNNENNAISRLDGVDVVTHGLSIKAGSGVKMVNVPNQKEARHAELFATGSMTVLAADISEKDWFVKVESHNGVSKVPFEYEHGTVQYNIINFKSTAVQLSKPKETSIDGDLAYEFALNFTDLVITLK